MKTIKAIGFAILSLQSINNAYQFIGTDYFIPYIIWVIVSAIFGMIALGYILKTKQN